MTCDCCLLSGVVSLNPETFGIFTKLARDTMFCQISSDVHSFLPRCRESTSCVCVCVFRVWSALVFVFVLIACSFDYCLFLQLISNVLEWEFLVILLLITGMTSVIF